MSEWVKETLEARLHAVSVTRGALTAKVSKVKDVEGTASIVASRGIVRHLMDYNFGLEYKVMEGGGEEGGDDDGAGAKPKTVCKGTLTYSEVACSKGGEVAIGGVSNAFKSAPTAAAEAGALE